MVVVSVAVLLALGALLHTWQEARRQMGIDFLHYWAVPRALHAGPIANIYSPEGRRELGRRTAAAAAAEGVPEIQKAATTAALKFEGGSLETLATPFLFSVFELFAGGQYQRDFRLYQFASLAVFAGAILALGRCFGYSWTLTFLFLALLTLRFEPLKSDLWVGNVNCLQLGLLAAALLLLTRSTRPWAGLLTGLLLGVSLAFKPYTWPAVLLLAGAGAFHWAALPVISIAVGLGVGVLGAVGVSSLYFGGVACWLQWLRVLPDVLASTRAVSEGNMGFSPLCRDTFRLDLSHPLLVFLLAITLVCAWHGRARARRRDVEQREQGVPPPGAGAPAAQAAAVLAIGCGVMLLTSRLVWLHYYLLAVPLLLYVLRGLFRDSPGPHHVVGALFALAAFTVLSAPVLAGLHVAAWLFAGGTLVLVTLGLLALREAPGT